MGAASPPQRVSNAAGLTHRLSCRHPAGVHMKQYDDLKALVRTHDQQAAELARVKAAAAAEIDAARADADAA